MRVPHPKTVVVGVLSSVLIVGLAYFAAMFLVLLPRAEATLDRTAVRLEVPGPLGVGERGTLLLRVDNRANRDPVRLRDALLSPNLAEAIRFDDRVLGAQGATMEGPRIVWNWEIIGGDVVGLPLPFTARQAGHFQGHLLVLLDVPRMSKGRSLPLTIEAR